MRSPEPCAADAGGAPLPDLLLAALREATTGVSITDALAPDSPLVWVNPAWEELTGYRGAEVVGRNARLLQPREADPDPVAQVRQAVAAGVPVNTVLLNQRRDGRLFWNELRISPVHGRSGAVTHFLGSSLDVTARVRAEREARLLRGSRPLAELPGEDRLLRELAEQLQRAGAGRTTGVLLCALDVAGAAEPSPSVDDVVLAAAGARVRRALRASDVLVRRGAAGFCALLTDLPADAAEEVLARTGAALLSCFDEPISVDGALFLVGASVGVAVHRRDGTTAAELLATAEQALASGSASTS